MRGDSPAVYACPSDKRRSMHVWSRLYTGNIMTREAWNRHANGNGASKARCQLCGLEVNGEDAGDLFRGAEL